jgi:CubicO group peptidase (beta-lactamase class C family)
MDLDGAAASLSEECAALGVPGAQMGLLRGNERAVLCAGTRAYAGAEPVTPATPFHAGSIAKALTALVVLDAGVRGELDVDVPCSDQSSASWDDTPLALMAQTTGRPNALPDADEELSAFVARVGAEPRVHAPGRFSYCNAGWSVLDLLLRERVGASFEELAAERVLGAATFGEPAHGARGHAVQPGRDPVEVPSLLAEAASAAGSRWWTTADELLDFAVLHLRSGDGRLDAGSVQRMRQPHAEVPGATVADSWGLGWALWHRPGHTAFGWAGFTGGHRAYLRCFPEQDAAVVVLASAAGPLFGPPGGSALFDRLLPGLLATVGVAPLPDPAYGSGREVEELVGAYGPLVVSREGDDGLLLAAEAFGEPEPLSLVRSGGDTFEVVGRPPGAMPLAFDDGLLYVGPFAVPRNPAEAS